MLCFPLDQAPDWRRPPFVTIFLIVVNICCFLFWQLDDNREASEAFDYYFQSELPEIELPAYEVYIKPSKKDKTINYVEQVKSTEDEESFNIFLYQMMRGDGEFLDELAEWKIISPGDS